MSISFPHSWQKLILPDFRWYLINNLHDIVSLSSKKEERDFTILIGYIFENLFDFLNLDDHDGVENKIGQFLFDQEELRVVLSVVKLLDSMVDQLGKSAVSSEFISHPKWPAVVANAKGALHVLGAKGLPAVDRRRNDPKPRRQR